MTLLELHEGVHATAEYPNAGQNSIFTQNYCLVGLAGEVGEVLNQWKKLLRGDYNTGGESGVISPQHREKILKELRGAIWYLTESFRVFSSTIDLEAIILLAELKSRSERGVIKGSGDNR